MRNCIYTICDAINEVLSNFELAVSKKIPNHLGFDSGMDIPNSHQTKSHIKKAKMQFLLTHHQKSSFTESVAEERKIQCWVQ